MSLINPEDMNFVSKPWGYESWICNNEKFCGKILFMKAGYFLSFHSHKIKEEVLFLQSGQMYFVHDEKGLNEKIFMNPGQAFHVLPGINHQMQAVTDVTIIEFSTQHFDEDSYRITREKVIV